MHTDVMLEDLIRHHALKMRIAVPHSENWYWHLKMRAERVREWRHTNTLKVVS